jgi:hypothetical protein
MGAKHARVSPNFVLENMNGAKGRLGKEMAVGLSYSLHSILFFKHEHLSPHLDSNF